MTTLADKAILSGADNRPPMLEKDMYDSWKSIMELYMINRQHGRMILESVENGLFIWPTIEENSVTRPKKYYELSATKVIQADCLIVPVFQKDDDPIDAINNMMSFLTAVVTSRYPTTNNQLRNSSNPRQQATIKLWRSSDALAGRIKLFAPTRCIDINLLKIEQQKTHDPTLSSRPIQRLRCPKELPKVSMEIFSKGQFVSNQSAPSFDQYFELMEFESSVAKRKDTVIKKLKERIKSLSGNMNEDNVKKDLEEIEMINIELDHRVSNLIAKNEHLKQTYKKLYDSIKPARIRSK
ncbi:hypothetical protein Tco_1153826 [Tanacetum coccineum]